MRSLVVAPGDLNEAKRLDAVLGAVRELDESVHVALVGRRIEGYDVDRVVDTARLGDRVMLAPDVSDDDFRGWLAAADVVVDLRFPHRGEVSGSLIRAMQAGKPSIVSATGHVPGHPRRRRAARGSRTHEPVRAGRPDPHAPGRSRPSGPDGAGGERRTSTGSAPRRRPPRGTRPAIEETLRLVRDPAHKAMAIWGKALADMGADEADLRGRARRELRAGALHVPRNVIEPPKSRGHALLDSNAPRLTCASTRGAPTSPPH